jgi:cytochrome c biogenesis protein CcdA/glutaredoxin
VKPLKIVIFSFVAFFLLNMAVSYAQSTCIYFFYGDGCPHCAKASSYIETLEGKYNLEVHRMNIGEEIELINGLYSAYNVKSGDQGRVPILFISNDYILGDSSIISKLESKIKKCGESGCACPTTNTTVKEKISLPYILGLAAVDAVNPCELAVLVILMTSILTRFPKEKMKALKVGLVFSLAIFLMYMVFGLLIISGFKFLTGLTNINGSWFFKLLGGLAIVLGLLNVKDAVAYGKGAFIMEVPRKWRPRMKKIIEGTTSLKGAFIVGLIVSFFLTPCTAGPYFVAGCILSEVSVLTAFPYLFLYLCLFILPMIAITLIIYFGFATVQNISGWREKNIKILHWIAGVILVGLGIAMILGLI